MRSHLNFRIEGLPVQPFAHLFGRATEALAAEGVVRRIADRRPGFPCRVSLRDADPGEPVLLLNYEHQPAATPYRSRHAIYVREYAEPVRLEAGEVPEVLRLRLLSARAFDQAGYLREAEVIEGTALEAALTRLLDAPETAYVHLHNAKPGCYAALAVRA